MRSFYYCYCCYCCFYDNCCCCLLAVCLLVFSPNDRPTERLDKKRQEEAGELIDNVGVIRSLVYVSSQVSCSPSPPSPSSHVFFSIYLLYLVFLVDVLFVEP